MKKNPYISVIVCSYNEEKLLKECIDSLLQQRYPNDKYEIVLIDDGSVDRTSEICQKAIQSSVGQLSTISHVLIEHSGLSVGRNTGVFSSKGDIVAFIDGDAVADENWLREIACAFDDDLDIGVVGGKIETLNTENCFSTFIHWVHYYKEDKNGNEIIPITGANMAFRKEVFQSVGGFYEQFKSRGDEHSFIDLKVLTSFRQNISRKAVVYHERPSTFREWFTERFFNGHEYALVHYISYQQQNSSVKQLGYVVYRVLRCVFLLFFVVGGIFNSPIFIAIGLASLICFTYGLLWRESMFIKGKVLKREYGLLLSMCLLPVALGVIGLGKMNDDYGFLRGLWKYRNTHFSDAISGDQIRPVLKIDPKQAGVCSSH